MNFPKRWVDAMSYGQVRAAWHGVYCERARDYRDRAAVKFATGDRQFDRQTALQLMGYAREAAANARREYAWMLEEV